MRLRGKTALVTGAASGFGAEIAATFAREGAKVVLMDINGDGVQQRAQRIGESARALQGDVSQAEAIASAVRATKDFGGRVDIVVNNAGWTTRNKPMLETTEEELDRLFNINLRSIFHMNRAVVPLMKECGGGVIINIGSVGGIRPRPGLSWYNSTKAAINFLSRCMALEFAPDGIRVNCVAPTVAATGFIESVLGTSDTPENRARLIDTIPLGRLATEADVASACVYLASDEAEFITGIILEVDGGRTI